MEEITADNHDGRHPIGDGGDKHEGADAGSNDDIQDYYQQHFLSSSSVTAPSSFKFPLL